MPYPVSEDTVFLANYLREKSQCHGTVLEVGCGNGEVTIECAYRAEYVVGTDVSKDAVEYTLDRVKKEGLQEKIDIVLTDKARPFRRDSFHIVVSNPPYLPCRYEEGEEVCGGPSGIEFSVELARGVQESLKEHGKLIVVASSLSDVSSLISVLSNLYSIVSVADELSLGLFEKLLIVVAEKGRDLRNDPPKEVLRD
jgi:release factor glutamine methyltransferase